MSRVLRELERVEHRVLAALRFVDASTGTDVSTPLELRALDGDAVFVRNRSALRIVDSWSRLADHATSFDEAPAAPPTGSLNLPIAVSDPSGRYLPRRVSLALPRDPDAEEGADSLFRAVVVPMYPAAAAATGSNWAVLRVTLTEEGTGDALGGALLIVTRSGSGGPPGEEEPPASARIVARGLTDGRGEALVAVPGIPMLTFGEDDEAVVVDEVAVTVEAFFDPAAGTRTPAEELLAGRQPPVPLVDPAVLESESESLPRAALPLAVAARRSQAVSMAIDLP